MRGGEEVDMEVDNRMITVGVSDREGTVEVAAVVGMEDNNRVDTEEVAVTGMVVNSRVGMEVVAVVEDTARSKAVAMEMKRDDMRAEGMVGAKVVDMVRRDVMRDDMKERVVMREDTMVRVEEEVVEVASATEVGKARVKEKVTAEVRVVVMEVAKEEVTVVEVEEMATRHKTKALAVPHNTQAATDLRTRTCSPTLWVS